MICIELSYELSSPFDMRVLGYVRKKSGKKHRAHEVDGDDLEE